MRYQNALAWCYGVIGGIPNYLMRSIIGFGPFLCLGRDWEWRFRRELD